MIREQLTAALAAAARDVGVEAPPEIGLEQPASREHGDWSTNLALVSAKAAGTNPRELAGRLLDALVAQRIAHVERIEIAGPGFVNFHLSGSWLHDALIDVVHAEGGYVRTDFPLEEDDSGGGPRQLKMSPEAVALAEVRTTPVTR